MRPSVSKGWIRAITVAIGIFTFFALYLIVRRGYFNIYIFNKALGSTAAILAGTTLLIGPFARRWLTLLSWIPTRRYLGLMAFYSALLHAILSTFFLTDKFPTQWFMNAWVPVLFGITTITIWWYLSTISSTEALKRLGASWKKHQHWLGHIAFCSIFFHLVLLKYPGWIRWLSGQTNATPELVNPAYPPASLFVFFFLVSIIVYRIMRVLASRKK